ncbi:MAG: AAA family ATPase [Phycisphaerae bacterium]|nr:AAA family ATPase [Saprospiraceae bacterium]
MIKQLHIENFRSIKKAGVPLGKFTVITGANNCGKSSFIYSLLTLKNLVNNPNQSLDNFFVYGGLNLGGFTQTVFQKDLDLPIDLKVEVGGNGTQYRAVLNPKKSSLSLSLKGYGVFELGVAFPYPVNQKISKPVEINNGKADLIWNGVTGSTYREDQPNDLDSALKDIRSEIYLPAIELSKTDFIPARRGFSFPYYGTIPLQGQITTEEEIATLLAIDKDLTESVSYHLEKIIDSIFEVRSTPEIANFYLEIREKNNAFVTNLVNEGSGTNQLVTMLAKILYKNSKALCMDEPEIHLHPSIINRFVASLVEISDKEEKQFILSTHSEQFLAALLRQVAEGKLAADDLCVYYLTKDKKGTTQFERQEVNNLGQIRGGYKSFLDAEMENLASLFQLSEA